MDLMFSVVLNLCFGCQGRSFSQNPNIAEGFLITFLFYPLPSCLDFCPYLERNQLLTQSSGLEKSEINLLPTTGL